MSDQDDAAFDYNSFVLALSSAALSYLGIDTGQDEVAGAKNLTLAKQNIDIICMLKTKTVGNLSEEEAKLTEQVLTDLRLKYVEASKQS